MNRKPWLAIGLLSVAFSIGCGGPDAGDLLAEANSDNVARLSNLYQAFQSRHDWRGPADEAEFKAFLNGWNPSKLEAIGVNAGAIDKVFVSPRDGEPFRVRYGVPGHIMGSSEPVVFEATGVDGKREVGFLDMSSREIDEAEYERLLSGQAGAQQAPAERR